MIDERTKLEMIGMVVADVLWTDDTTIIKLVEMDGDETKNVVIKTTNIAVVNMQE